LPTKSSETPLHMASRETYDFEFESDTPGEIPMRVENTLNNAKLLAKIICAVRPSSARRF